MTDDSLRSLAEQLGGRGGLWWTGRHGSTGVTGRPGGSVPGVGVSTCAEAGAGRLPDSPQPSRVWEAWKWAGAALSSGAGQARPRGGLRPHGPAVGGAHVTQKAQEKHHWPLSPAASSGLPSGLWRDMPWMSLAVSPACLGNRPSPGTGARIGLGSSSHLLCLPQVHCGANCPPT